MCSLISVDNELLQFSSLIVSENACKLEGNDGPFTIADFGTADGLGFIQIIPDLVGKIVICVYSITINR